MTTTLRPAEPERRGPDGRRSRHYLVCVNGRPAGSVLLSTDRRFGPEAGRIEWLGIDEPDRRRGRATVAALAAEEVLRSWRCRWIEAGVPARDAVALRLAALLGYVEHGRSMVKKLADVRPPLPEGTMVRPMDAREYADWHERERRDRVRGWAERGVPYERAVAAADAGYRELLPDGHTTAGAALRVLRHDGADVGYLWLRPHGPAGPRADAWLLHVEVCQARRGRGHGRALMLAAERECRAAGARGIGLEVRAGDAVALGLCESLGYQVTEHHLAKPLL